jgi:hypothetical protein
MPILHLLDQAAPQACPSTLALMRQSLDRLAAEQQVLLLGGAPLQRSADQAGIRRAARLGALGGQAVCALPAVRHHMRHGRLAHLHLDQVDLVHCWSIQTFTLAMLLWRQVPRVLTLTAAPSRRAARWLSTIVGEKSDLAVLLAASNQVKRALLLGGVPEAAVHVLRPGIDLGATNVKARPALRRRWHCESEDVKVVALLADPPHAADAVTAIRAVMLAADAYGDGQQPIRLLVCPDQQRRRSAERMLAGLKRKRWMVCEPQLAEPWNVLPGCDLALAVGPGAGGLSLLWAMAASVPIVGEASYRISEIVEDRHSALLAKPDRPWLLAHRIQQLIDDEQLAWRVKDAARSEVYSIYSPQRYRHCIQTVYEQLLTGRPVRVPEMQLTGGLRFMGKT